MTSSFALLPDAAYADYGVWLGKPKWSRAEAAALLCELNPDYASRPLALVRVPALKSRYDAMRRRMVSTIGCPDDATPAEWLALAKSALFLSIPERLAAARAPLPAFAPSRNEARGSRQSLTDALAEWLRSNYSSRPVMRVDELLADVRKKTPHLGHFELRTFERALAKAFN